MTLEFVTQNVALPAGVPIPSDPNGPNQIRIRQTFAGLTWYGGIFNVGVDGMTSGDTFIHYCTSTSCVASDRYSGGRNEPDIDTSQDLPNVIGWYNTTHTVVEYTRYFVTADPAHDIAFTNVPGSWYRYMWTYGASGDVFDSGKHGGATGTALSSHGYVGETGQIQIDFAGNKAELLTDGVKWPSMYYVVAATIGIMIVSGLLFQIPSYRNGVVGRWMRSPIRLLHYCFSSCIDTKFDSFACNLFGTLTTSSVHDLLAMSAYILFLVIAIVVSVPAYVNVGRSPSYLIGHLVAIQLAFLLLPVTRNSIFQRIFGISFNDAIAWHRRISRVTVILTFCHGVAMLVLWDFSVAFSTIQTQWAMGTLYGTLAFLCMLLLSLFAIERCRRSRYPLFFQTHLFFATLVYVFSLLHSWQLRWLCIPPAFFFFGDIILRFAPAFTRKVEVDQLVAFQDGNTRITMMRLKIPNSIQYMSGDHVYVNLPSVSWYAFHPISISSAPLTPISSLPNMVSNSSTASGESRFLTLHVQAGREGNWSSKLYDLSLKSSRLQFPRVEWSRLRVHLDGPYHSGDLLSSQFPVNILVAGGIGITPILSIINSLLTAAEFNSSKSNSNQTIANAPILTYLIWSSRSKQMMTELFLEPIIRVLESPSADRFKMFLHLTKPSSSSAPSAPSAQVRRSVEELPIAVRTVSVEMQPIPNRNGGYQSKEQEKQERESRVDLDSDQHQQQDMESGRQERVGQCLKAGRPNLQTYFSEVKLALKHLNMSPNQVLVTVCGPEMLAGEARKDADEFGFHYTNEGFKY